MPTNGGAVTPESDLVNGRERRQLDIVRRWGTIGALLLTVGSLGGGAAPTLTILANSFRTADHIAAHGLDPAGLRRSITAFLGRDRLEGREAEPA